MKRLFLAEHAAENRQDGQHQENVEQDLGDAGSAGSNAAKSEHGRDDGDDEKYDGVMQNGFYSSLRLRCRPVLNTAANLRPRDNPVKTAYLQNVTSNEPLSMRFSSDYGKLDKQTTRLSRGKLTMGARSSPNMGGFGRGNRDKKELSENFSAKKSFKE